MFREIFRCHETEYLSTNPLNAELNPICHLLTLLGGATIIVVSRLRVKEEVFVVQNCYINLRIKC